VEAKWKRSGGEAATVNVFVVKAMRRHQMVYVLKRSGGIKWFLGECEVAASNVF